LWWCAAAANAAVSAPSPAADAGFKRYWDVAGAYIFARLLLTAGAGA